jgi:hypothetical protein
MKSPCCNVELIFRSPKYTRRAGVRVCRLLCPACKQNWLATDSKYSHPYQTRKRVPDELRRIHVSGRMEKFKLDRIIKQYNSFQKYLDFLSVSVVQ